MLSKTFKVNDRKEYLIKFFEILNILQSKEKKLSETNIIILVEFLSLPESYSKKRFSSSAIKEVANRLGKFSKNNVNTNLYKLIEKGYVIKDPDGYRRFNKNLEILLNKNMNNTEISLKLEMNGTHDN